MSCHRESGLPWQPAESMESCFLDQPEICVQNACVEVLFFWVGLLFAVAGFLIARSARRDFHGAIRASGEIIGYVPNPDAEGGKPTFAPVVAFDHPLAGRRVFQSAFSAGNLLYPVGQTVNVLADPSDPTRARIDTNAFFYFGIVFIIIGLGCCAVFLSIFDWSTFSVITAVVVSFALGFGVHRKLAGRSLAEVGGLIRQALGGNVVEEAHFDRSSLLPATQLAATRRRLRKQMLVISIVSVVLGVGGLLGSYRWSEHRLYFLHLAKQAEGRVVSLEASHSSESTTWTPIVEFQPPSASSPVRFRHSVGSSPPSWKQGQEVQVLYDPHDPSHAMIDQGRWNLVLPLIPGAVGLLLLSFGLSSLKKSRQPGSGGSSQ